MVPFAPLRQALSGRDGRIFYVVDAKQMEPRTISAAIKALRAKLGETQVGMARLLGASLRTYDRWEAGDTIPRGDILVRIMDLCPDEDTRSLFRAAVGPSASTVSGNCMAFSPMARSDPRDRLRMRFRNSCIEAISIIYESALLGSAAADEKLRNYADELNRSAIALAKSVVEQRRGAAEP